MTDDHPESRRSTPVDELPPAAPDEGQAPAAPRARRSDRRRSSRRRAARATAPTSSVGTRRGRRSDLRRRRRRRTLLTTTIVVVLLSAVAVAVVLGALGLDRARDLVAPDAVEDTELAGLPGGAQPTLALVTHEDDDVGTRHIALLAYDRAEGQGTVLFVPPATVADVPGHGSFGVGEAFAFGDRPLLGVTLENLLGIRIDGVASVPAQGWARLLDRAGGLEVELPAAVAGAGEDGGEARFEAGVQHLEGPRLAEYLMFRAAGESELDTLPRLQRVLGALLDALQDDALVTELADDPALQAEGVDDAMLHDLLAGLAGARAQDRVAMLTLPVSPLAADRTDAYRVDAPRMQQLIEDRFAASRPDEETGAGRSLQVLNGVGTPGIGQAVAERLQPGGYRVLLTGNADDFDHDVTRIVVYDDTPEQLDVARDIRERLGVGEIERSGTPQSVVDVTVIVGADLVADLDVPDEGVPPVDGDAPGGSDS